MRRLCRITFPGFSTKQDFKIARTSLMREFPTIDEVIATTAPGTLLILASGPVDIQGWEDTLRSVCNDEARGSRFRLVRRDRDNHAA
ncbi:MAG TPA: hypothetical protein VGH93_12865 [Solirubrobacteraceae bacterium]|jgi:hypothetical protein